MYLNKGHLFRIIQSEALRERVRHAVVCTRVGVSGILEFLQPLQARSLRVRWVAGDIWHVSIISDWDCTETFTGENHLHLLLSETSCHGLT